MSPYFKLIYFFIIIIFGSCLTNHQDKIDPRNSELEQINNDLLNNIKALKAKIKEDTIQPRLVVDSLSEEIIRLRSFVPIDSLNLNDSLKYVIDSLSNRLLIIERNFQQLQNQLRTIKQQYVEIFSLPGTQVIQIKTPQSVYDCYKVNLKETNLALFWQNENGQPLRNIDALQNYLSNKGQQLIFAMNAGMYKPDNSPQGLYIQDGKELRPIDRRKEEYGNFYMQPNGVFCIDTAKTAKLLITDQFNLAEHRKAVYATQSGPMAVIDGNINEKFNINSNSKHIRNGVGIIDKYNIVFVISNQRVNLYDFANVFKKHFNCLNALYLDGAISRMYLPEIQRLQKGGNFGPLIGIYK